MINRCSGLQQVGLDVRQWHHLHPTPVSNVICSALHVFNNLPPSNQHRSRSPLYAHCCEMRTLMLCFSGFAVQGSTCAHADYALNICRKEVIGAALAAVDATPAANTIIAVSVERIGRVVKNNLYHVC